MDTLSEVELSSSQRDLLADYWWQRAEGERTSWVGFEHVRRDLEALGAPSALLEAAAHAVADEYKHSLWCEARARHFGAPSGEVRLRSERAFAVPGASDLDNRLLRVALSCLTETLGVVLLQQARADMLEPAMRRLNQGHLRDEVQHSRLLWGCLAALPPPLRQRLTPYWPLLLDLLACVAREGIGADHDELVAHGYISRDLARRAHEVALADVIFPGLRQLGLWGVS